MEVCVVECDILASILPHEVSTIKHLQHCAGTCTGEGETLAQIHASLRPPDICTIAGLSPG